MIEEKNTLIGEINNDVIHVYPELQEKEVTPIQEEQEVTPDENVYGLSKVVVDAIPSEYVIPSGTLNITGNGTYDVTNYENANVSTESEWAQYGYSSNPPYVNELLSKCESIQENYDTSITSWYKKFYNDKTIIIFPLVDTSNVTGMSQAFDSCSNLQNIPILNTSNVTAFYNMFSYCSLLKEIPLLNTSNGTNFSGMFYYCTNLINVPDLDLSKGTNFSSMFYECINLETAPNLNCKVASNVNYRQMFYDCLNLKNVPYFDISQVSETSSQLQDMFRGCKALTDNSINNILKMCSECTSYRGTRTLYHIGFRSNEISAARIQALSNYQAFINAGWSIGY